MIILYFSGLAILIIFSTLAFTPLALGQNNETSQMTQTLDEMLKNAKKPIETSALNFTKILSTLTDYPLVSGPLVEVEYQSNSMVVLKADESYLLGVSGSLAGTAGTMGPFWKAIDIIRQYGYSLDDVTTSGVGSQGNPTRFYAIMSKP